MQTQTDLKETGNMIIKQFNYTDKVGFENQEIYRLFCSDWLKILNKTEQPVMARILPVISNSRHLFKILTLQGKTDWYFNFFFIHLPFSENPKRLYCKLSEFLQRSRSVQRAPERDSGDENGRGHCGGRKSDQKHRVSVRGGEGRSSQEMVEVDLRETEEQDAYFTAQR